MQSLLEHSICVVTILHYWTEKYQKQSLILLKTDYFNICVFSNYVLSLLEYQIIILETRVRLWNQKCDSIVLATRLHLILSTICVEHMHKVTIQSLSRCILGLWGSISVSMLW